MLRVDHRSASAVQVNAVRMEAILRVLGGQNIACAVVRISGSCNSSQRKDT